MNEQSHIISWADTYFSSPEARRPLICALLALQRQFGYLPKEGLREIAARMGVTPANVYGIATFYNQFRFVPPGKHEVKVCMGTACHIKQGQLILDHWQRRLGIAEGEVTADREYSLDRVACVGCCTLAPVTVMGEEVIGHMSATKVDGLLLQHQIKRDQATDSAESDADA
jgi:NADH-quinone oxidoreductase subunit E